MRPIKVVSVVVGALLVVAAAGALTGAGALLWADSQRNAEGFFQTRTERFRTDTYALATERLGFDADPDRGDVAPDVGTLRVSVTRPDGALEPGGDEKPAVLAAPEPSPAANET